MEVKVRELAAKIEVLEADNAKLKEEVANLQPKTGIDINAAKILKILFDATERDANAELSVEEIAYATQLKNNLVQYHLDKLISDRLVDARPDYDGGYYITPLGRAFVIEKGLAG